MGLNSNPQRSANIPPPKPWEQGGAVSGSSSPFKPPSTGSTSQVVEASGTARPGEVVSASNRNTINSNVVSRPLPTRPWEQQTCGSNTYGGYGSTLGYNSGSYGAGTYGSYGGLGGGMYGGGMYSNNMYRGGYGGLYGSGMYGGGMYNGGFGGPMAGYGMGIGGPYGPQDPNNPHDGPPSPPGFWMSVLRVLQGVVSVFGRISFLIDENVQALHMFMSALLQLFDRTGSLYGELARFVLRLLGIRRTPRKIPPGGPNPLPLPGPDGNAYAGDLIEGPRSAPKGSWDNLWKGNAGE